MTILLLDPESLNVEIKRWINLADAEGQAKIIKAALAIRFFLVGFDDATLLPEQMNVPSDVQALFHLDTPAIQLGVTDHIWSIGELMDAALKNEAPMPAGHKLGPFRVINGGRL